MDDWTNFLKERGLRVGIDVVRKVAERVVAKGTLCPLYDEHRPEYCGGKGTVYKIKTLVDTGKLDPFLHHYRIKEPGKEAPIQLAHLRAYADFLRHNKAFRESFSIKPPNQILFSLRQPLAFNLEPSSLSEGSHWKRLPIYSNIKQHCPQYSLWKTIEQWEANRITYRQSIEDMVKNLHAEFHDKLPPDVGHLLGSEQEHNLLIDISIWATERALPTEPYPDNLFADTEGVLTTDGDPIYLLWVTNPGLTSGAKYAAGTEHDTKCLAGVINGFIKSLRNSPHLHSVVHQYYALTSLEQKIKEEINQITDIDLTEGTCPDCPSVLQKQAKDSGTSNIVPT
jgi:hypothetical protein